jgi:hypothetical protein
MLSNRILVILILLLSSFVFPANDALACSKHTQKEVVKNTDTNHKSCCAESKKEEKSDKTCCCNHDKDDEDSNHCPNCKCCVSTPVTYLNSSALLYLQVIEGSTFYSYEWSYSQPMSDKHFNSIWQPPQFS